MQDISVQLSDQKRLVDFKSYDLSVKELISMVSEGIINISPEYQRKFRWEDERLCRRCSWQQTMMHHGK